MILTKIANAVNKKSYTYPTTLDQLSGVIGYDFCNRYGWSDLTAYSAFNYYKSISIIYNAVNMISNEFSNNIVPVLKDKKTGEIVKDVKLQIPATKILTLLEKPNFDKTRQEFMNETAVTFQVTGNNYFVATLSSSGEPLELYNLKPQDVQVLDDSQGQPVSYSVTAGMFSGKVFKKEFAEKTFNVQYKCGTDYELWAVRNFNPTSSTSLGLSPLAPIYYEIEQFLNSNIHNDSLLKKGARPSGILTLDTKETSWTEDQIEYIKESLNKSYKGASNAGNVFVTAGGKDFKELSINNKDMDFANLKEMVKKQLYQNLRIPMPLISEETMTYSNYEEAKLVFYDMTILPYSNFSLSELSRFLLPKYKDGDKYILTYDQSDIPALKARHRMEVDREISSGVLTIDESRAELNRLPLKTGGDTLYQPMNLIPIGQVTQEKQIRIEKFKSILEKQGYSSKEIRKKVEEFSKDI